MKTMVVAEEAPIHGDILEAIFSHVPLIHLVPASHVSKSWNHAVSSSLAHVKPIKPWLMVLTQRTHSSHVTTHAYDPRSQVWMEIKHDPSIKDNHHVSTVRSSHSSLLYALSPSEFSFSFDALRLNWHRAPAPRVWRTDPIVARVGKRVVVAGGACYFEEDPLAVEMYDMETFSWITCEPMPEMLKGSSASTWLSVAVIGESMILTEKNSGVSYSFDTICMKWNGPYDLRPDQSVQYCVTGSLGKRLMVVGVMEEKVKLWEVKRGELGTEMEEVSEMPKEMVRKVKGVGSELGSVEVSWVGDCVYVRNTVEHEEFVVCEVVEGKGCEWRSVRNVAVDGGVRMVVCGGDVTMEDLKRAVMLENKTFCMKQN